jgi:TPR repeat protein
VSYADGSGVAADVLRSHEYYSKACTLGLGDCCLAVQRLEVSPAYKQMRLNADLVECQRGAAEACGRVGRAYLEGEAAGSETRDGVSLLERGCDGGDGLSCGYLADAYVRGSGGRASGRRIRRLYERACKAGIVEACRPWRRGGAPRMRTDEGGDLARRSTFPPE